MQQHSIDWNRGGKADWKLRCWGGTSSQTCYLITSCVTSHRGIFKISSRVVPTLNTQHVIAKVCFTAVVQCWGISMQSWAEEEVAHYKPREEAVISLSWKLRICQGAKFSPILTPPPPIFLLSLSLAFDQTDSRSWMGTRLFANLPRAVRGGGGAANGNLPQKLVTRP